MDEDVGRGIASIERCGRLLGFLPERGMKANAICVMAGCNHLPPPQVQFSWVVVLSYQHKTMAITVIVMHTQLEPLRA